MEGIFESLLSFTSEYSNIEVVHELTSLPENIIPFARDPFGGLICFDYRPSNDVPVIVFFDEELENNNITFICESFSELINRLLIIE
ncbi:SMI1/KNR4 family protein [Paenibacillus woosongensis]|uniref:SMI1/KNR4 family protein n=1 Tax=Paenibacillus woosongensis TaxID=307580 RepID=A0AA95L2B0_9BACL|nr:SMI1/KNR4 family protein [Paenibacillus woosongensis]WHX50171.1 SMI1/KNR4 family protein [Paenibacillus woosongensis]